MDRAIEENILQNLLEFINKQPAYLTDIFELSNIVNEVIDVQKNFLINSLDLISICEKHGWNNNQFTNIPIDIIKLKKDIEHLKSKLYTSNMDLNIDVLDGILQFMDKMPNSLIESSHVYAFTQIISESIKIQENNPLDGMEYLSAICKKYGSFYICTN